MPRRLWHWNPADWPRDLADEDDADAPGSDASLPADLRAWWSRVYSWRRWQWARWAWFREHPEQIKGLNAADLFTPWPPGESPRDRYPTQLGGNP